MSSRGLKILVEELVPAETRDKLNENPWFKAFVLILFLLIGPFLIKKGVRGVKDKVIVSKGREYTGTPAVIISLLWILSGLMLIGAAVVMGFLTFVYPRLG